MPGSQGTPSTCADQVLTGQASWVRWFLSFKADARADDTWSLFDGTEKLLTRPLRSDYIATPPALGGTEGVTRSTSSSSATTDTTDFNDMVEIFKMDLHDYGQQHARVRRANKMLHDRIDQSMHQDIGDMIKPKDVLDHLRALYKMQDARAVMHAHNQISATALQGSGSMTAYLSNLRQLKGDLTALGESYTEAQLIAKIVSGLTPAYNSWAERFHDIMADPDATHPSLKGWIQVESLDTYMDSLDMFQQLAPHGIVNTVAIDRKINPADAIEADSQEMSEVREGETAAMMNRSSVAHVLYA